MDLQLLSMNKQSGYKKGIKAINGYKIDIMLLAVYFIVIIISCYAASTCNMRILFGMSIAKNQIRNFHTVNNH